MLDVIQQAVHAGERISREQAEWLYEHATDTQLQELSTSVRDRFHRPKQATWLMMAIVNFTNGCVAKCDYCAFYKFPWEQGAYMLSFEQICERVDTLVGHGGTLVGFNSGFHPDLKIQDYAELFAKIIDRYQGVIDLYAMTIAEFMFACKISKLTYDEGAAILYKAGVRWITGGGAEVLDDAFRMRHSPGKYKVADYYDAQAAILRSGMGSTATMVIGFDETLEERMNHLEQLRSFQDQANGALSSFLCWTYKPYNTDLGGEEIPESEYLRWLAISRVYLDNIRHIRTSVLTRNEGALRGLGYGADDFDLPTEDEVTEKAGATINQDFDAVLQAGRDLGYELVHRKPWGVRSEQQFAAK